MNLPPPSRGLGVVLRKEGAADNHGGFSMMILSLDAGGIPAKRRTFIFLCTHHFMVNQL
jgi:hypothetical protein